MDNVTISFQDKALKLIAKTAQKRKVGARALRGILESLMLDIMYDAPTSTKKSFEIGVKDVELYIKQHLSKELQDKVLKKK